LHTEYFSMKPLLLIYLILPLSLLAQHPVAKAPATKNTVNVTKDGLVTVGGKVAFYMITKSVVPWESDYVVENLQHQQLAYLKLSKGYRYTSNSNSHQEVQYYAMAFSKDGAHCEIRDYMKKAPTIKKALAIVLVNAKVIQNGKVDAVEEKKFVEANYGFMTPAKEDTSSADAMNNSAVPHADGDSLNGEMVLRDGFIYYEQQIIGTYTEKAIDADFKLVQVFSVNRNKVAEVTHESGATVWRAVTVVDQQRVQVPYNQQEPLKELFRYLLRKRYL